MPRTPDDYGADALPVAVPEEPPDQTFWQSYSPHLELPIASMLSVFAHVLLVAGFVGLLLVANCALTGRDKTPVPITLVQNGEDDAGKGNPLEGGVSDGVPNAVQPVTPPLEQITPPTETTLPQVQTDLSSRIPLDDPSANIFVSQEQAKEAKALDDLLRERTQGAVGKGNNGPGKPGPGGTGEDNTRARSLRWIMRFKTANGQDYLDQLAGLGATVLIPIPPDNKRFIVFRPPFQPGNGQTITENELGGQFGGIQFCDGKPESTRQVAQALRLTTVPNAFWAFFPKMLEEELSAKEKAHHNLPAERIAETVFEVVRRNGKYEMLVVSQKLK